MVLLGEVVQMVWEKARVEPCLDPDCVRRDCFGAWIHRQAYGDTASAYGWCVDHIVPPVAGGGDGVDNLRPVQWQNSSGGDGTGPRCVVVSIGGANALAVRG